MERITNWIPGYDKRSSDPKENYGVGAIKLQMIVKGPLGAVVFDMTTARYPKKVQQEMVSDKDNCVPKEFIEDMIAYSDDFTPGKEIEEIVAYSELVEYIPGFRKFLFQPQGWDIGYHSRKQMYEGQKGRSCHLLDGDVCYYDGSSLQSENILNILLNQGETAVWEYLEDYYRNIYEIE